MEADDLEFEDTYRVINGSTLLNFTEFKMEDMYPNLEIWLVVASLTFTIINLFNLITSLCLFLLIITRRYLRTHTESWMLLHYSAVTFVNTVIFISYHLHDIGHSVLTNDESAGCLIYNIIMWTVLYSQMQGAIFLMYDKVRWFKTATNREPADGDITMTSCFASMTSRGYKVCTVCMWVAGLAVSIVTVTPAFLKADWHHMCHFENVILEYFRILMMDIVPLFTVGVLLGTGCYRYRHLRLPAPNTDNDTANLRVYAYEVMVLLRSLSLAFLVLRSMRLVGLVLLELQIFDFRSFFMGCGEAAYGFLCLLCLLQSRNLRAACRRCGDPRPAQDHNQLL